MINLEAERAVITSILVKPRVIDDMIEILQPADFTDISYGLIYNTLTALDPKDIDIISLAEKLSSKGVLEQVGGMPFLSDLFHGMATSANALSYARVLKDKSNLRSLGYKLRDALANLDSVESYADAVSNVGAILESTDIKVNGYKEFKDIVKERMMGLDARCKAGGGFEGLRTGFDSLDETIMGLKAGDYCVIGARPSMGKTAFSLAICQNVAKAGGNILYFSAESSKESLTDRVITSCSGVDSKIIKSARLSDENWSSLAAGVSTIKNYSLNIIDISGIDISHAKAIARKFNRKRKVDLIVVDYLQLMTCKNSKGDFEVTSSVSRGLKAMAKDTGCPIIALAQLSRKVEERPNKRPLMSDLRATGQIEQDADVILFIYRDEYYNEDSPDKGITELTMRKSRDGELKDHFFKADFSTMRYEEINYTQEPQAPSYKPFAGK